MPISWKRIDVENQATLPPLTELVLFASTTAILGAGHLQADPDTESECSFYVSIDGDYDDGGTEMMETGDLFWSPVELPS